MSDTVVTIHKLHWSAVDRPEYKMTVKWAEYAATHGGSFSVSHVSENSTYVVWTINWPNHEILAKTGEIK